jgi:aryl-alcohol dehydrogenase-like predicted oxidoreductase
MRTARISWVGRSPLLVAGTSITRFAGKWFKQNPGKREHIFLATKFALKYDVATSGMTTDSTPEYCRQACEKSLSRLGVDCVDLYY